MPNLTPPQVRKLLSCREDGMEFLFVGSRCLLFLSNIQIEQQLGSAVFSAVVWTQFKIKTQGKYEQQGQKVVETSLASKGL